MYREGKPRPLLPRPRCWLRNMRTRARWTLRQASRQLLKWWFESVLFNVDTPAEPTKAYALMVQFKNEEPKLFTSRSEASRYLQQYGLQQYGGLRAWR